MIVTVTLNPALDRTLTIDRLVFGKSLRAQGARQDWGGKGLNVSRALQRLGVGSLALGFTGGEAGRRLANGLHELGIVTDFTSIAGETRTNTVIHETGTGAFVKVNEPGPEISFSERDDFLKKVQARAAAGDWWVLSGSLPPGLEEDFYATLIELLKGRGARVALDTSGEPLRLGAAARPHLVTPNRGEAGLVVGSPIRSIPEAVEAARAFLAQGIPLAGISLGRDGLVLASKEAILHASPPRIAVRSSIGTGDALVAGVLHSLERGLPLEEVARWGVATGTAAALQEGVQFGGPEDVEALLEKVQVSRAEDPEAADPKGL